MINLKKQQKQIVDMQSNLESIKFLLNNNENNEQNYDEIESRINQIENSMEELNHTLLVIDNELDTFEEKNFLKQIDDTKQSIEETMLAIKNVRIPPDPYKKIKDFVAPNLNKINKFYDKVEFNCNSAILNNSLFFVSAFNFKQNERGQIRFNIKFTENVIISNATFQIYLNNELVKEQFFLPNNINYEKEIKINLNSFLFNNFSNIIAIKLCLENEQTEFVLNAVKFEIIGFNANIISKLIPAFVSTNLEDYLICDCLSGEIKIGQANFNNLMKLQKVVMFNTGFLAQTFKQIFTIFSQNDITYFKDRIVAYFGEDLSYHCLNLNNDSEITFNTLFLDFFENVMTENEKIKLIKTYFDESTFSFKSYVENYNENLQLINSNQLTKFENIINVLTVKHIGDYINQKNLNCVVYSLNNGENYLCDDYVENANQISIGYGSNITSYYNFYKNENDFCVEVYINVFGKIVKKMFNHSSSGFTLISSTELGQYDFYFKGQLGDYFVTKNNKLLFYKFQY